jgi:predicted component of type VI protein secretion system
MAILEYEIGGNEVKIDASEGIANLPDNRSLIVEHLTADEPASPEAVTNLTTIDQVFAHFKPNVDVEFQSEDGQPVKENLHFSNVGDFSVKSITQQSAFLSKLDQEKTFYSAMEKQLRSNKVLQRALENPETKAALIAALQAAQQELN